MTTDLAYKILGIDSSFSEYEIEDAFEMKCFTIKKEILMQKTFLESFLKNKTRLINQLQEAKNHLFSEEFVEYNLKKDEIVFEEDEFLSFFISYESEVTSTQLKLSSAISQEDIISSLDSLNSIQKGYLNYLQSKSSSYDLTNIEEIPLKDQIDSGLIIKELKSGGNQLLLREVSRVVRLFSILKK